MACNAILVWFMSQRVLDALGAWLWLLQLPGCSVCFSLLLDFLLFVMVTHLLAYVHGQRHVDRIIVDKVSDALSDIVDLRKLDEHRDVFIESLVVWVVVPRDYWQATLRLQHVGGRRVVNDHGIFHVAPELGHVLHKHSVYERAVLSEEPFRRVSFRIHLIHQRISVLEQSAFYQRNPHLLLTGRLCRWPPRSSQPSAAGNTRLRGVSGHKCCRRGHLYLREWCSRDWGSFRTDYAPRSHRDPRRGSSDLSDARVGDQASPFLTQRICSLSKTWSLSAWGNFTHKEMDLIATRKALDKFREQLYPNQLTM